MVNPSTMRTTLVHTLHVCIFILLTVGLQYEHSPGAHCNLSQQIWVLKFQGRVTALAVLGYGKGVLGQLILITSNNKESAPTIGARTLYYVYFDHD